VNRSWNLLYIITVTTLVHITHYTSPNYTDHPQVNIHYIEMFFTVQDFLRTLCLPWKTEFALNFSLYWIFFLHSGLFSNLRLPRKTEFALDLLYGIYFFTFRVFDQLALALKIFKPGGCLPPPRTPVSLYQFQLFGNKRKEQSNVRQVCRPLPNKISDCTT